MNIKTVLLLISYAALMSIGQIMFKMASGVKPQQNHFAPFLAPYLNLYFIGAIVMYFGLTVFWVWLVKHVPLSKAYPVVALSFIFTPLLASFALGEVLSRDLTIGSFLIISGVYLLVR